MKFFHTADWHLGKLVHGVYMTEDQEYVLNQLIEAVDQERPDAVIIAGDVYDRAVPPTEAVQLLDEILRRIIIDLQTPVLVIAGNHDSPGRLHFASSVLKAAGLHIVGHLSEKVEPVIIRDDFGEVHFHLVPYAEPGVVKHLLKNEEIRSHDDAMEAIVTQIIEQMDNTVRHVFIGHHFVTPKGEKEENTSDSERPLAIGGAEQVNASYFSHFHYSAFGHLHQAHKVGNDKIRYAGSPLKYSISEETHNKGFYIVEMDDVGNTSIEKRLFSPRRDMRTIEGYMKDIQLHDKNEDYVFVRLLDDHPVLFPMEKIRAVYPNAMHIEQKKNNPNMPEGAQKKNNQRTQMDELSLFKAFYTDVKGTEVKQDTEDLFRDVLQQILRGEGERT
ncbi:exonuclease SbcCD subunit D [Cytobacillus sp. IB215316]|uniref:exonuclease SbcCD subunit D n=1 Tax=Cytobacillus sp. IB215316 TaxID=3097354 RepID=UPI002A15DF4F|nr:exonuclease SbcCD subunit D [Cytobacillus sp. IB215316]MDX8361959.1 exonuclease SbcCD subunit D [Cytobacillus sp. IB215316]